MPENDVAQHSETSLHVIFTRFFKMTLLLYIIFFFDRCETIAIGNGVASRETEQMLSDAIKAGGLRPLNVMFWQVLQLHSSIFFVPQFSNCVTLKVCIFFVNAYKIFGRFISCWHTSLTTRQIFAFAGTGV